ncbi:hypothetical protein CKA32_004217 [Geitlerinema sp. FC II]|nr:hypothetical protein CKA32_004217 [Geitlerinema sp. FC II]
MQSRTISTQTIELIPQTAIATQSVAVITIFFHLTRVRPLLFLNSVSPSQTQNSRKSFDCSSL